MKNSPKTMHSAYPVGMQCTVGKSCLNNPPGTIAVVYEHYTLGEHHGISLIFPNGNYDGFSEECASLFEVTPERFIAGLSDYNFENVMKLALDFDRGIFDSALGLNRN